MKDEKKIVLDKAEDKLYNQTKDVRTSVDKDTQSARQVGATIPSVSSDRNTVLRIVPQREDDRA